MAGRGGYRPRPHSDAVDAVRSVPGESVARLGVSVCRGRFQGFAPTGWGSSWEQGYVSTLHGDVLRHVASGCPESRVQNISRRARRDRKWAALMLRDLRPQPAAGELGELVRVRRL